METLHLATLGTSRQPLEQLLTEAAASYRSSQRQRTGVWSVDQVRQPRTRRIVPSVGHGVPLQGRQGLVRGQQRLQGRTAPGCPQQL